MVFFNVSKDTQEVEQILAAESHGGGHTEAHGETTLMKSIWHADTVETKEEVKLPTSDEESCCWW
jgi:hypothetical protein